MELFSVRATFSDNTFYQLRFTENLQNELNSLVQKPLVNRLGIKQR